MLVQGKEESSLFVTVSVDSLSQIKRIHVRCPEGKAYITTPSDIL